MIAPFRFAQAQDGATAGAFIYLPDLVDGQATEEAGTPLWFYWKNYYDPAVSSALISSASGASPNGDDGAFCYIDADDAEVCG